MHHKTRTYLCLLLGALLIAGAFVGARSTNARQIKFGVVPSATRGAVPAMPGADANPVSSNGAGVDGVASGQQSVVNIAPAPLPPLSHHGVGVAEVAAGSPADIAGLQKDDVLLSIDGEPLTSVYQFRRLVRSYASGAVLRVVFRRDQAEYVTRVRLGGGGASDASDAIEPTVAHQPSPQIVKLTRWHYCRISKYKERIRTQLQALPDAMDSRVVINSLQAIRDVTASVSVNHNGWMAGSACDARLEFIDAQGRLILHGVNNTLTLCVYDNSGRLVLRTPLNTSDDCLRLPADILQRLKAL